jgi:hypothetical protein
VNEVGKFLLLDWVPQPQVALHSFTFLHSFFSILVSMKILCIYKQVWKSIHNKYKAFRSKCKHTRGKPNQQKNSINPPPPPPPPPPPTTTEEEEN